MTRKLIRTKMETKLNKDLDSVVGFSELLCRPATNSIFMQLRPVNHIACQNPYHPIFLLGIGFVEPSVIIPLLPQLSPQDRQWPDPIHDSSGRCRRNDQ
jgi:hypothetical protein